MTKKISITLDEYDALHSAWSYVNETLESCNNDTDVKELNKALNGINGIIRKYKKSK